MVEFVKESLEKLFIRYKKYYDRKIRIRSLKVGDKVFVFLLIDNNKLLF